jgi:deoxyribodipyrimidine photolyase-like uncharacterized protein
VGYISRMSDYCRECDFDPKKNCPFTPLYWAFFSRHEDQLRNNPRLRIPILSLQRRPRVEQQRDEKVFSTAKDALLAGDRLTYDNMPDLYG